MSMHDHGIILPLRQLALPGIGDLLHINREEWMCAFAGWMRPYFERAGLTIPNKMRFGTGRRLGNSHAIGRCHPHTWSSDGTAEITIDLSQDDSVTVGATIVHEMIHAHLRCHGGHGKQYRRAMGHVGLVGNPTATEPSLWLIDIVHAVIAEHGIFPHAAMSKNQPRRRRKADAQGYVKVGCSMCRWFVRMTRAKLRVAKPPCCNRACARYGQELYVQGDFADNESQHPDQPQNRVRVANCATKTSVRLRRGLTGSSSRSLPS